jgi:3-phenylpropionate/trans-cinnamate dioxygenase ferredoxin reductase component
LSAVEGIVIVGAGECGTRAAFALREEGYGGPITLIGAERHLPYERPPLSKEGMVAIRPGLKEIAGAERFEAAEIRLLLSVEAVAIDRAANALELAGGTRLPYEKLVLATGARPRRLPLADGSRRCVYLRTHDDAEAIANHLRPDARIAIIGGGFIGLEIAASARRRGCEVVVLEALPRLLARAVPAPIASVVEEKHRKSGVDIRCGVSLSGVEDEENGLHIALADGTAILADCCIVGIGAIPNVELAARAGLAVENGIAVDEGLHTEDPSIFAAGDCCSFPLAIYGGRRVRLEAWRNAQDQGSLAARSMLGKPELHAAVPWFWSDQYDLTLQIAGLVDEGVDTVRRDLGNGSMILFHLAADGRLVAASGIGPGNAVARDVRVAEMLIARRAAPPRDTLANAETKLKSLLAAA